MVYNRGRSVVYSAANPWFSTEQIHGFTMWQTWFTMSMVYTAAQIHGLQWHIHGLQYDRSMVYNAADTWFSMRQIHDLQLGRSMVYNAAG
jgi:hypothetical protein